MEYIRSCCDGYAKIASNKKCVPVCEDDCIFGTCTEPNKCTCNDGYKVKQNHKNV